MNTSVTDGKISQAIADQRLVDQLPLLEDACRRALMVRIGIGETCPACSAPLANRVLPSWYAGRKTRCRSCGFQGTWRQRSPLGNSHASCAAAFLVDFAEQIGADRRRVAAVLGLSPVTVGRLAERLAGGNPVQSGVSGTDQ